MNANPDHSIESEPAPPHHPDGAREVGLLAETLRSLFSKVGLSVTRFAAASGWERAQVVCFLTGGRVPPWRFVEDLAFATADWDEGGRTTPLAMDHLRAIHRAALRGAPVQLLREQLATAVREVKQAARFERRLLGRAWLAAQQPEGAPLVREEYSHGAVPDRSRTGHATVAVSDSMHAGGAGGWQDVQDERTRGLLAWALQQTVEAEERCADLEQQLDRAEGVLVLAASSAAANGARTV